MVYTASPVLGTPQGISVFLDGMRFNEPFGDVVVGFDPQIAIANVTVAPGSNPASVWKVGGAIALNTKSGFAFPGGSAKVTLGSFGRRSLDAEEGCDGENITTTLLPAFTTISGLGSLQFEQHPAILWETGISERPHGH